MRTVNELHIAIFEKSAIECADVEHLLGDLAEGDLMPSLETRVRDHICECDHCQESEKSYTWVIEKAKLLKPEPLPSDVSRRLRMALNERLGISLTLESE